MEQYEQATVVLTAQLVLVFVTKFNTACHLKAEM